MATFSEVYFPKRNVFNTIIKVIPQLISIINENQIDASFKIDQFLSNREVDKPFDYYESQNNSSYQFKLKNHQTNSLCYLFAFNSINDRFSIEITFNNDFPFGMVQFDYNCETENSLLRNKVNEMITVFVDYELEKDKSSFHFENPGHFGHTTVSISGFSYSEGSGRGKYDSGRGDTYTLEEFYFEKKGQNEVRSIFSKKALEHLIKAAELRLKFPYLF